VLTDDHIAAMVRQAYERDRSILSYDQVLARADGSALWVHRNRWRPLAVALALVAAVTVIAIVVDRFDGANRSLPVGPPSASPIDTKLTSDCAAQFGPGLPPLQFSFTDGNRALLAYVDDRALVVCVRASASAPARAMARGYPAAPWDYQLPANRLGYVLFRDTSGIQLILGTVPAGADRVTAQTTVAGGAAAQNLPATLHGGYFAIWAPHAGLDLADVVAEGGGASVASGPPTAFMGNLRSDDIVAAFQASALATLTAAGVNPQRVGNITAQPNQIFGSDIDEVALYGDSTVLVACILSSIPNDGLPAVDCHNASDDPTDQPLAPMTLITGQTEHDGYVLGIVPPGVARVTVSTGSIAEMRAEIRDGLFSAYWTPPDGFDQQRLMIDAYDGQGHLVQTGASVS
jgi:hypothetical protein